MLRLVRLTLSRLAAHPVRSALVVLTLALGTSVVAVAFSLRLSIGRLVDTALPGQGSRIVIANGQADAAGVWEWELPPRFVEADAAELAAQEPAITAISPYQSMEWRSVEAGGRSWRLRAAGGTGSEYASVMGLRMLAGSFFTADDVLAHEHVVVLSESAARTLFGDAASAVGQQILADSGIAFARRTGEGAMDEARAPVSLKDRYRVIGVFRDPPRLGREAYGIPEALIPHTAFLPPDISVQLPIRAFVAAVSESRIPVIEESVRLSMVSTYGEEVKVAAWEGDPRVPLGKDLQTAKEAIRGFSAVVAVLSAVILFMSSFGIFSSLMAEGADAGRETGIMRAVGARRGTVRLVVITKAAILGLAGGALGAIGALALGRASAGVLGVLLESIGLAAMDTAARATEPLALLLAVGAAVVSAVLLGLIPAALTARASIVEAIKES